MVSVRSRVTVAAACAALVAGLVAAGPAGASPAKQARNATDASGHSGVHPNTPSTYYGAGFFSYPGIGNIGSVSVTFKMPNISCHKSTDQEWLSPGIWVYDSSSSLSQFSAVEFNCNSGSIFMGDVMCVDSYATCDDTLAVNPGDRVVASLSESSTTTRATVRNLTTAQSMSITSAATTTDQTVFIGDVGPTIANAGVTHVPTFTNVAYSKAQVNGQYLGDLNPARWNLATTGSTVQEKCNPLSGDGDAFSTTFLHN